MYIKIGEKAKRCFVTLVFVWIVLLTSSLSAQEQSSQHILSAVSDDGINFIKEEGIRIPLSDSLGFASVPYVIRLPDGRYRLYFVGYNPIADIAGTFSAISTDTVGLTFQIEPGTRIENKTAADPCVIELPDGNYRLYYVVTLDTIKKENATTVIKSAISYDEGMNFQEEDSIFGLSETTIVDPEVVPLNDTTYRMYITVLNQEYPEKNRIISFVSQDSGKTWVMEEDSIAIATAGVSLSVISINDSFRMYFTAPGHSGGIVIYTATSSDGLTWYTYEDPVLEGGGENDPLGVGNTAIIKLPDGRYRLYYNGYFTITTVAERKSPSLDTKSQKFSPNPTSGILYYPSLPVEKLLFRLFNSQGQLVVALPGTNGKIHLPSYLKSGVYFSELTQKGEVSYQKIILLRKKDY